MNRSFFPLRTVQRRGGRVGRGLYATSLRGGSGFHVLARLSGMRFKSGQNLIESWSVMRKEVIQPFNDGWPERRAAIGEGILKAQDAPEKLYKPSLWWKVALGGIFEVQDQRLHGYS